MVNNIAIIGSSGAIGSALVQQLSSLHPNAVIHAFSRHHSAKETDNLRCHSIDYESEGSIQQAALLASKDVPLDMVIVATGILHDGELKPEKCLLDLSEHNFQRLFQVNTIQPALIAKYFLPKLKRKHRTIFAVLSARVGSISDNRLGGWYAYRASKAALNMLIKSASIEIGRSNKQAIVVTLHPGTVNSHLSEPFKHNVPENKLFTPAFSAASLLNVVANLTPTDSGKCFAWDGEEIEP